MQFKEWLLTENPHATLGQPVKWQGGDIVIIDLRAEDWRLIEGHPNFEATQAFKRKISMYQFNGYPPFYGRIPSDNRYLVHDGKDSFNFSVTPSPPSIGNATNLDDLAIVGGWWDYVIGYDRNDQRIKQPRMVRSAEVTPQPSLAVV